MENRIEQPKYVRDLFEDDFFLKLQDFLLADNFNDFYNQRLKVAEETEPIADLCSKILMLYDYDSIKIYSFEDFINMFENIESFQLQVESKIFNIKYLISKFDQEHKTDLFCIKLYYAIINRFYTEEIILKLANTRIIDLSSNYIAINDFIVFDKNLSVNNLKINLIFFIMDYVLKYMEMIFIDLQKDLTQLLDSYRYESRYLLQAAKTSDKDKMAEELRTEIKRINGIKYNKEKGNKTKNRAESGVFNNYKELQEKIDIYKEVLSQYKSDINKMAENKDKKALEDFLSKWKEEGRSDIYNVLSDYYNLRINFSEYATVDKSVHISMNYMFGLNYFNAEEDFNFTDDEKYHKAYLTMKKDIERKLKEDESTIINDNYKNIYDEKFSTLIKIYTYKKYNESIKLRCLEHLVSSIPHLKS